MNAEGARDQADASPPYVVVTPARNEAANISTTIASLAEQEHTPRRWVIVDDGSTDETPHILAAAQAAHPWVTVVRRSDRGHRSAGSGVVEAVNEGVAVLTGDPWEFLVKLDADLSFGPSYFTEILSAFRSDPDLGIAGGTVYNVTSDGRLEAEAHPTFHVRGATKVYRRACWEDIGGLVQAPGWDTIDEVTANMHGWTTRTLPPPIHQHRMTGAAAGQWKNWEKNGRAAYLSGYHPLFVLARAASRTRTSPHLAAPAGLIVGYTKALLRREDRAVPADVVDYVHRQQLNRLLGRPTIWR